MTIGSVVASARRKASGGAVRVAAAEIPSRRVFQRASGTASVPLSGTISGQLSAVSARIINAATSVEVVAWTQVYNPSVSTGDFSFEFSSDFAGGVDPAGSWSGTLTVPQGGWYKAQYRLAADPSAVFTGVNVFGVGDVWMFAGQSQQARMSTLVNAAPAPDDLTAYFTGGTAWSLPGAVAGTGGNGGIRFLNVMRSQTGVPQAILQVSVEGTAITDWEPADTAYTTAISRLTQLDRIAGVLWHQGGTGIGTVTRADYKTRLAAIRAGFEAAATVQRFAVFPLMHRTNAADTDFFTNETRRAHYEYLAENPGTVNLGWYPAVPMADDVHQTAAGSEDIAYAYAHALLFALGVVPTNNLGPVITGASRSGTAVTLTVQHRAGTTLKTNTGLEATGFQVFPRATAHNDGSALPISSVTLNASTIVLTLATNPATAVDVYYEYGRFDNSSPVFDDVAVLGRTTGNALQPLLDPVQSPIEAGEILNPALKLDNSTGHARYPLTSGWNLPDTDWTVGVWARVDNPAGTTSQYLVSTGAYQASQSFNMFLYEANVTGTAKPGAMEVALRGAGATAFSIVGAASSAFLDTSWRLFVVERVKASELINIYSATPGSTASLYFTGSVSGVGAITPTTAAAVGTRAPPLSTSERWLAGAIHSVFKLTGRLTVAEMTRLARGDDLVTDLGRSPDVYTKFNSLSTPVSNLGSATNADASLLGGITLTPGPQFSVPSNAVQFDETGLIYTMPKTASHNFPSGEWTLGVIMALDDNDGTVAQYVYSTGGYFAAECLNLILYEASSATNANTMAVAYDDGSASIDDEVFTPSIAPYLNGQYYLWTVEHDAGTGSIKVYTTPVNGTRTLFASMILPALLTAMQPPTAVMTIGGRNALAVPANRYFGGRMHSMFQMDGRLNQTQMEAIASGRDLVTSLGLTPKWYHKFSSASTTLTDLSGNGNTATASGGTPVVVPGPDFVPNG